MGVAGDGTGPGHRGVVEARGEAPAIAEGEGGAAIHILHRAEFAGEAAHDEVRARALDTHRAPPQLPRGGERSRGRAAAADAQRAEEGAAVARDAEISWPG